MTNRLRLSRVNLAGFAMLAVVEVVTFSLALADGHPGNALASAALFFAAAGTAFGRSGARRTRPEAEALLFERPKTLAESPVPCAPERQWPAMTQLPGAVRAGSSMKDFSNSMARLASAAGGCPHLNAVPVDLLITGERVAWCCPDCPADLPTGWTKS